MSGPDPRTAPRRTDLPYLRHRSRPISAVARRPAEPAERPAESAATPPAATGDLLDLGPAARPSAGVDYTHHRAAPSAEASLLDLSAPAGSPPAPPVPAAAPISPLSAPISSPSVPTAAGPVAKPAAAAARTPRRVRPGSSTVLTPSEPTLTLTRLQSGIGVVRIEAACSPAVGDLRLGAAYQLRSGTSSVVQLASGVATAPPKSNRPVIIGQHGQFESLIIDLVQSRELVRLVVYAFSESGRQLDWGGTLVLTTCGQARVELPLDRPPSSQVGMLMSIYNIDGEFVIRAEMEQLSASIHDSVSAYGFDRITWLDARTPLV